MPTTSNRGYEVPVTGTEVDTWGDVINANMDLIDNNIGGVATVALTNVNVTLTANQYACGTIRFTGTLTGNVIITFPSVSGWWVIDNRTTGNFYVQLTCGAGNKIATQQGTLTDICTDGSAVSFRNLGKIGEYWDYAGSAVPNWVTACTVPPYLLCDGSTFSAVTYPHLNTILGGTTLPDSRNRVRIPLGGGTGRITTAGCGIDGTVRFAAGGSQTHTLTEDELAEHDHAQTAQQPTFTYNRQGVQSGSGIDPVTNIAGSGASNSVTTAADATPGNTGNAGGGEPHNNVQPTYIGGITMIRAA